PPDLMKWMIFARWNAIFRILGIGLIVSVPMHFIFSQADTTGLINEIVPDSIDIAVEYAALGDLYGKNGFYSSAVEYLELAAAYNLDDPQLLLKMARYNFEIGNFHRADSLITHLGDSLNWYDPLMDKLRASITHFNYEFDEAIKWYKKYLVQLNTPSERREVAALIQRAANGLKLPGRRIDLLVENMGPRVNTEEDEIRPLFSPNIRERIYFSSNREGSTGIRVNDNWIPDSLLGRFPMDMYQAELIAGRFGDVKSLNPGLSSPLNDIVLDFSNGGSVVYHFRGFSREIGRIFVDTFGVDMKSKSDPRFHSPFVPELGDQGLSFVNDSIVVFSSNRPGGYGGYDLYMALFRNGGWSEPVNLGPAVNSPYDEIDPFVTHGGKELFFSSNRTSNMGGVDVYHSNFNSRIREWMEAESIGLPLNSAGSDRYFRISNDGKTCMFSSDRKGGHGGYDIYLAYFRSEWKDQFEPFSKAVLNRFFPAPEKVEPTSFLLSPDSLLSSYLEKVDTLEEISVEETVVDTILTEGVKREVDPGIFKELTQPFYYDEKEVVIYDENINRIEALATFLQFQTDYTVQLEAFSSNGEPIHRDLFFSVKKAEEIAHALIDYGVSPERITVVGRGSSHPLAIKSIGGAPHYRGQQINRRIEVLLSDGGRIYRSDVSDGEPDFIEYPSPEYAQFLEAISGVYFKVQTAASKTMYSGDELNAHPFPKVERIMDSEFYRYTVGLEKSLEKIRSFNKELELEGLEGIFVVPFMEGKRLTTQEIHDLKDEFIQLKNFK
nr:PD40 domain-containing protein [Saprospiraceae bacterium]